MAGSFEEIDKQLLELAVEDYKTLLGNEGPISGNALDITKVGGLAAVLGGVASGVGTLFAATKGAPASVVVATLAVVAVAILALAWIIRSDHAARTAVTVDLARVVPQLIAAARPSPAPAGAPAQIAAMVPAGSAPSTAPAVVSVGLKAMLRGNPAPFDVMALRLSNGSPEYLVARLGQGVFEWKTAPDVEMILPA
jgi:hypothetical protein